MKTYEKKEDFIQVLESLTDKEINDYIKKKGKPPKIVMMCHMIKEMEESPNYYGRAKPTEGGGTI